MKQKKSFLSSKHKRFCELLIKDKKRNATKAYLAVYGCKESTASRNSSKLLKNADINGYLQGLQKEIEKKVVDESSIDAIWVINKHKEIIEKGLEEVTVFTKDGDSYVKPRDLATANNATRDIGKHLGIYQEDFKNAEAIAEDFQLITKLIKKYVPDKKKYNEFLNEFKQNSRMYQS